MHRGKRILLRVSTGFSIEVMTGGFYSVKLPNQAPYQLGHTRKYSRDILYTTYFKKAIGKLLFALMGGLWYAFGKVDFRGIATSGFALLAMTQL